MAGSYFHNCINFEGYLVIKIIIKITTKVFIFLKHNIVSGDGNMNFSFKGLIPVRSQCWFLLYILYDCLQMVNIFACIYF